MTPTQTAYRRTLPPCIMVHVCPKCVTEKRKIGGWRLCPAALRGRRHDHEFGYENRSGRTLSRSCDRALLATDHGRCRACKDCTALCKSDRFWRAAAADDGQDRHCAGGA